MNLCHSLSEFIHIHSLPVGDKLLQDQRVPVYALFLVIKPENQRIVERQESKKAGLIRSKLARVQYTGHHFVMVVRTIDIGTGKLCHAFAGGRCGTVP